MRRKYNFGAGGEDDTGERPWSEADLKSLSHLVGKYGVDAVKQMSDLSV